jgi:hypothetical protein
MKKHDLQELEKVIMKEVVKRRSLGGYNSEAESVLLLSETLYRIIQHLVDEYPTRKIKPE